MTAPYLQTPFDPFDFPTPEPEIEVVEWHPGDEVERYNRHLLAEIDFLRETLGNLTAGANRRFNRSELALAAALGVFVTVLAILLFGPG